MTGHLDGTHSPRSTDPMRRQAVGPGLDDLVRRARRHLTSWVLARGFSGAVEQALVLLMAVPLLYLVAQTVALAFGYAAWALDLWQAISLTMIPPVLFLAATLLWHWFAEPVARPVALGLFDLRLGLKDRLVTADEFLHMDESTSFIEAAIDDALPFVDRALTTDLPRIPLSLRPIRRSRWLLVPASVAIVFLATWVAKLPSANTRDPDSEIALREGANLPATGARPTSEVARTATLPGRPDQVPPNAPHRAADSSSRPGALDLSDYRDDPKLASQPSTQGDSSATGVSAISSSSSNQMSPSDQSPSEKATKNSPVKKHELDPSAGDEKQTSQQTTRASPEKSDADGGNDSSSRSASEDDKDLRQSHNERSGTGKKSDRANADQPSDEERARPTADDGSDMDKKKRGGSREGGNALTSSPDPEVTDGGATNPGGSTARKKSRGVMSEILGTPLPDSIIGHPNDGPIKKTQEKAKPGEERALALEAQDRTHRADPVGNVEHPDLSPTMQDVVRSYFLAIRKQSAETEEGKL